MIAGMFAAACLWDLAFSPTPTVKWNHDQQNTALYRVYAQRAGEQTWPWHLDLPYWTGDGDSAPVAPGVTIDVPVQRVVPTSVQLETVRVMVKAVSAAGVESAPSNVLDLCMPEVWMGGPYR